jgi:hypothetical protein
MWILYRHNGRGGSRLSLYTAAALYSIAFTCNECEWIVPGTVDPTD